MSRELIIMETKDDLIKQKRELEDKIREINSKLKAINKAEILKKYNVSIGDEITIVGKKAVITNNCGNYLYYTAYKKDGTLGTRETRIWNSDSFTKN